MHPVHLGPRSYSSDILAEAQKINYEQLQAAQAPGKRTKIDFTPGSSSKGRRDDHGRKAQAENRWIERDERQRYRPYPQDIVQYRSKNDSRDSGASRPVK